MKTRRFATTADSGNVSDSKAHAAGFVSSTIVSSDGLCSEEMKYAISTASTTYED